MDGKFCREGLLGIKGFLTLLGISMMGRGRLRAPSFGFILVVAQ